MYIAIIAIPATPRNPTAHLAFYYLELYTCSSRCLIALNEFRTPRIRLRYSRSLLSGNHHTRNSLQIASCLHMAPVVEHGFDLCLGGVANLHHQPATGLKHRAGLKN